MCLSLQAWNSRLPAASAPRDCWAGVAWDLARASGSRPANRSTPSACVLPSISSILTNSIGSEKSAGACLRGGSLAASRRTLYWNLLPAQCGKRTLTLAITSHWSLSARRNRHKIWHRDGSKARGRQSRQSVLAAFCASNCPHEEARLSRFPGSKPASAETCHISMNLCSICEARANRHSTHTTFV